MFAQSTLISYHTEAFVKTEVGCTVKDNPALGAAEHTISRKNIYPFAAYSCKMAFFSRHLKITRKVQNLQFCDKILLEILKIGVKRVFGFKTY